MKKGSDTAIGRPASADAPVSPTDKTSTFKLIYPIMKSILLTFGAVLGLAFTSVTAAERYALLVAIDDYSNVRGASNLPGCTVDLKGMNELLTGELGYPSSNVKILTDSGATKANILRELDALVAKAQPGDAVVIYYSGHGGQVPDMNDDDETADNLDEALITADFNPRSPDTWLLDDHLRASLSRLKTKRTLVLIDACHSGTGTMGDIINKQAKFGFDTMLGRGRIDKEQVEIGKGVLDNHVLISGCAANEVSAMGTYDGVKRSLFTTALLNVMPRSMAASLGDFQSALYAEMQSLHPTAAANQHPQVETTLTVSLDVLIGDGAGNSASASSTTTVALNQANNAPPVQAPSNGLPSAFPVQVATDKREYVPGETMVATVVSDKPGYLRLYYVDKKGNATLIFPNYYQKDNRINGRQRIEVGSAAYPFAFRMKKPGGTELLLAAVSEQQFSNHDALNFSKDEPMKEMGKVTSIRKLVDSGTKEIEVEARAGNASIRPSQIGRAAVIYEIRDTSSL